MGTPGTAAPALPPGRPPAPGRPRDISSSKLALEAQKVQLDQEAALGEISASKERELRKAMVDQQTALEVQGLQERLKSGSLEVAERKKIEDEIQQIYGKASLEKQKLDNQEMQTWKKNLDGMTQGWTDGIQKMLNGTMSLHNGVQAAMKGMGDYVEKAIIQSGLDWAKGEALKLAKSLATQAGIKTAETTAAATTQTTAAAAAAAASAANSLSAISQINAMAAMAGAAAFAASCELGPAGVVAAPAASLEAFTIADAFTSLVVPSAEGGWERVPSDTLAMIHKNEQILPADYAEGLRNLVANQGQGGSGSDTHNHLHVHAVDAKGVAAFFQKHQSSLFKTFQNGMRTGRAWGSGGDPRR